MKKLIIVESPAKAGTITKFLGNGTKVIASKGHIRDLPKSRLGINIEKDFEPEYINIRGKGDLIKELKKEAKNVDEVYLATDPDREGEAIAWHLAYLLNIPQDKLCRITFNEITKEKVKEAVKNPRKIDINLVDAQQSRRVLDRIVGYKISPLLWKKIQSGLSAGRVQSATLKIIIDREKEIRNFIPEEYWNIEAILSDKIQEFISKFYGKDGKKIELNNKKDVDEILSKIKNADFVVKDIEISQRRKNPSPSFTTSTLQQTASRKLGFTIKKTMQVAQMLYEGIKIPGKGNTGLITYMRTDSTRISEEARQVSKNVIENTYGKNFYENRYFKQKKDSQDAHEAIRPSYPDITPQEIRASLTDDQYKLYNLIYTRFIASQMAQAVYDTIKIKFDANSYDFITNGSKINFPGFLKVYNIEEDEEENNIFPELKKGDIAKLIKINPIQSFTQPPARYTEASLVKVLEENGIGRPSTYSPTINTIIARRYIEKDKKQLIPTELGELVNDMLEKSFPEIVDANFTAKIEEDFDDISEGKITWKNILKDFYDIFEKNLKIAEDEIEKIEIKEEISDEMCEICGKPMVYKNGRFGKFLACQGYPECKNTKPINKVITEKCPICGGKVFEKKSKKNVKYYICENNKGENLGCSYISWTKPGEEAKPKIKKARKKL